MYGVWILFETGICCSSLERMYACIYVLLTFHTVVSVKIFMQNTEVLSTVFKVKEPACIENEFKCYFNT